VRHAAANPLLADGVTLAVMHKQLRHGDPRVTLCVSAHVMGDRQRTAVEFRSARIAENENYSIGANHRSGPKRAGNTLGIRTLVGAVAIEVNILRSFTFPTSVLGISRPIHDMQRQPAPLASLPLSSARPCFDFFPNIAGRNTPARRFCKFHGGTSLATWRRVV
jgi:hypothetical protein